MWVALYINVPLRASFLRVPYNIGPIYRRGPDLELYPYTPAGIEGSGSGWRVRALDLGSDSAGTESLGRGLGFGAVLCVSVRPKTPQLKTMT